MGQNRVSLNCAIFLRLRHPSSHFLSICHVAAAVYCPACPAMSPSGESTAAKPSLPTRTVPPISVSYARTSRTPKPASSAGASCPTTCISSPSRGAKTPWRFCCGAFTADTRSTTTSTPGGRAISGKTASSPARWDRITCGQPWPMWTGTRFGRESCARRRTTAGQVPPRICLGWTRAGFWTLDWWRQQGRGEDWAGELAIEDVDATTKLRRCTYAGRPFASESLVKEISQRFGRSWTRGRPKKEQTSGAASSEFANQFALF